MLTNLRSTSCPKVRTRNKRKEKKNPPHLSRSKNGFAKRTVEVLVVVAPLSPASQSREISCYPVIHAFGSSSAFHWVKAKRFALLFPVLFFRPPTVPRCVWLPPGREEALLGSKHRCSIVCNFFFSLLCFFFFCCTLLSCHFEL